MEIQDSAQEWQRLSELYRSMSDEQLLDLAKQYADLTSVAQQVLAHEFSSRKLQMPEPEGTQPESPSIAGIDDLNPDSQYADDRKLEEIQTVWSSRDASQIKRLLDSSKIPFVMMTSSALGPP